MSNARILSIKDIAQIKEEFRKIGVDPKGIEIMSPKAIHQLVKLEDMDVRAANIIKQEMLSRGGDAAISRGVYDLKAEKSDIILMGTLKQFKEVCEKLTEQPFELSKIASEIEEVLLNFRSPYHTLKAGGYVLDLSQRTYIMGVLNVTPDSFSDGGKFCRLDKAVEHGLRMVEEGADIIDVGGESTRPGAEPVSLDQELERVIPVIELLASQIDKPISIDTYKCEVARRALDAGASIVNDISGLRADEAMVKLVAERCTPVVIMHMRGTPRDMQINPQYKCVMGEIISFLRERAQIAIKAGIPKENIIVDPGIGFGKTREHNLEIMRRLPELKSLGYPILIGTSRKSFIGFTLDLPVEERLEGTAATVAYAIAQGANIVRVHDVKDMVRVVRMTDAMISL
ncbi:MAG: dihydropteroate synthase [Actinomycetota bacterium]|nr:dihydropteroate synthase [Actinomycetota bacterium]MDI6822423.1 dihydropteroate synthase [Actinomycetota bacterium]